MGVLVVVMVLERKQGFVSGDLCALWFCSGCAMAEMVVLVKTTMTGEGGGLVE
jgi:hypothetical protein